MITEQQVVSQLRAAASAAGSQRAYAESIGVSEAYLSDVLAGRRAPGPKVLAALGLEAVILYQSAGGNADYSTTTPPADRH
jgi:DNA-binding transcriptional regulator YdaS (Cro superfamily)